MKLIVLINTYLMTAHSSFSKDNLFKYMRADVLEKVKLVTLISKVNIAAKGPGAEETPRRDFT